MVTGWIVSLHVCSRSAGIQGIYQCVCVSLSPLLPWQHIFCMEIASLAVPTAEKKGTLRDFKRVQNRFKFRDLNCRLGGIEFYRSACLPVKLAA